MHKNNHFLYMTSLSCIENGDFLYTLPNSYPVKSALIL